MGINDDQGKIYQMADYRGQDYPLFAPRVRERLTKDLSGFAENPAETVRVFENSLCAIIVAAVRGISFRLGQRAGEAVLGK